MKNIIQLIIIFVISVSALSAQPGSQDISVTSPTFLPAPLPPPNAVVNYRVTFSAPNGVTLLPLETVGITVCLNKLEFVSPTPVIVSGTTVFTNWQIDNFAPNCATAVINMNQPILTSSMMEFTLRVTGTSLSTDNSGTQNNVNVNLQPHANDPSGDVNDQAFVSTYTFTAIDYGDLAAPPYPQASANILGGDVDNDGTPDGIGAVWAGIVVDTEPMQNTPANIGDDVNGLNDDDGLTFPSSVTTGNPTPYNYFITTNSNSAGSITRHYGLWFDWNDDGTFDSFQSGNVTGTGAVTATASVTVPANAVPTYKVRLVVSGNVVANTPGATFNNAEVEDYQNNAPLPIELLHFTANPVDNAKVLLQWSTASEKGNAYFSVQRSPDGSKWQEIKQVKGAGNAQDLKRYDLWDQEPHAGLNYYRLQQFDTDGTSSFSPIRAAMIREAKSFSATLYPNPGVDKFYLQLHQTTTQHYQINIFNQLGVQLPTHLVQEDDAAPGNYTIHAQSYPSGCYQIRITNKQGLLIETLPMIKK
jgi:hypothetical protein